MKNQNKLIIFLIFIIAILSILLFRQNASQSNQTSIPDAEVKSKLTTLFGDDIKEVSDRALVLTSNDDFTIFVVDESYILLDYSQVPPKIHHYESDKDPIQVKILEIYEDGSYLVEHDDHTHVVTEPLPEGAQVGDNILIKDPHTYLYERGGE